MSSPLPSATIIIRTGHSGGGGGGTNLIATVIGDYREIMDAGAHSGNSDSIKFTAPVNLNSKYFRVYPRMSILFNGAAISGSSNELVGAPHSIVSPRAE